MTTCTIACAARQPNFGWPEPERMFAAASRLGVAPPGLTGAVVPEGPVADAAVADAAVALGFGR